MIKKIMSLFIIGILATGMIGCSNKKSEKEDKEIVKIEESKDINNIEKEDEKNNEKYYCLNCGREVEDRSLLNDEYKCERCVRLINGNNEDKEYCEDDNKDEDYKGLYDYSDNVNSDYENEDYYDGD